MSGDPRLAAAESLLSEHGVYGASVTAEGPDREIAAVAVPDGAWDRLLDSESQGVVAAIRALGFRYVALDLIPSG